MYDLYQIDHIIKLQVLVLFVFRVQIAFIMLIVVENWSIFFSTC